jgi:AraC-like DNA-binding protein
LFFSFGFFQKAQAQKKLDHITLNDSAYREGYIQFDAKNPTTNVSFKRRKKDLYEDYSIKEISEFYGKYRSYLRKTLDFRGEMVTVFLERLIYDNPTISVYKWMDKKGVFFIESESGLSLLGDDFREEISNKLDDPSISTLVEISKLNYTSLSYLLTVANKGVKSQTFSRFFRVSPQVGLSSLSLQLALPTQNNLLQLSGTGANFGLNLEFLPTYDRNLSLNILPSFLTGRATGFNTYTDGESNFETDIYFNFSSIQIPATVKYYIELQPNSFRAFVEMGYLWSSLKAEDGEMDIAQLKESIIATDSREFNTSGNYHGIIAGLGFEKYLKNTMAFTLGIRYSSQRNTNSEKMDQLTPYIGFKF